MKEIISISLGEKSKDYSFKTFFLGQDFQIRRYGFDGDIEKAANKMLELENSASAIGLGTIRFPFSDINQSKSIKDAETLKKISKTVRVPVTTGDTLRKVSDEWAIRHLQFKFGNYFNNARVLFLNGTSNLSLARVLAEYTDNLSFADPVVQHGIPQFIQSIKDMERYNSGIQDILNWVPSKSIASSVVPLEKWNRYILRKAIQKATIIVVPYFDFYKYLADCSVEELGGKIVITSTAYDDRVSFLYKRGVDVIIDTTPKVLEHVVDVNVLEAIIYAAMNKQDTEQVSSDDMLEIISEQHMDPRVIYPSGKTKRVNRFAFVIHPLSQEYFKNIKLIDFITGRTTPKFLDALERVMAYAPPFIYSKVTGIKSPNGIEAEGWLITVGGTPKEMLSHQPEFTYRRLLMAAKMAKRLGAQIMGLGAFTKVVGDAGATVARLADIPITTGNSYSASGALWAAADAVRRMGLIQVEKGKKISAKTMVMGATGAIGSVCCRLLALAFEDIYLVGRNMAKLLAIKQSIEQEAPDVTLHVTTQANKYLPEMDVIVTATSGAGKTILDITKVKPGCIITDVARPLDLSPEDVKKRPDVLVIESGEILLPGNVEMNNIGLPPNVAYACLAETIVLALEGRFEIFTIGRDIEWQKVKEIYKMGLKHGMKLAAISGVNGVFSDEDIQRVKELALEARKKEEENIQMPWIGD
ncbi:Shikimate/quinate 5-dehydrogenase [Candidatus Magnetomorum sp. HK-1]|nr:Shikimate/quinate 5-dehydrogenase [Candidatus Magnetomorum sp. HK-1]